jgi:hypothetical protein
LFCYFPFDIPVRTATDAKTDGTGCTMSRESNDPNIMTEIFSAELGTDTEVSGYLKQFCFEL